MAGKRGRPPSAPITPLGRRIARLLAEHDELRNFASLARKIGMDPSNLAKVLRSRSDPKMKTLADIAQALSCSVADIWPPADFSNGNAPYRAWREFRRQTEIGRSMTPDEIADLGALRFQRREPTVDLYISLLLDYRSKTVPLPPDLSEPMLDSDKPPQLRPPSHSLR
jgi:transcriptional regulator with XRE-family HTH domain